MTKIYSEAPYYDDYDVSKNYHKIIFNPSTALQSRELTQLQSGIQEQLKRVADFTFSNGAMVFPGNVSYEPNTFGIKLNEFYNGLAVSNYIEEFIGKNIISSITGINAYVVHADKATDTDPPMLYVFYRSGGTTPEGELVRTYGTEELLYIEDKSRYVSIKNVDDFESNSSLATVISGVYYINGYFVQNRKQTISLNKFDKRPSYVVGFDVVTSIVTVSDDSSLYDNSAGFNNPVAVGADRMHIDLVLTKYDYFSDLTNTNFIPLLSVKDGEVQTIVDKTELGQLGTILSRRTYDESGDYILKPIKYEFIEYRNNNRGDWLAATPYLMDDVITITQNDITYNLVALNDGVSGSTIPVIKVNEILDGSINWVCVSNPKYNNGYYPHTDNLTLEDELYRSKVALVKVSGGKMYIKGKEVDVTNGFKLAPIDKTRDFKQSNNYFLTSPVGQYLIVTGVRGLPVLTNIDENNRALINHVIYSYNDLPIGVCKIRNFEYNTETFGEIDPTTLYVSSSVATYKAYIFDLKIDQNYNLNKDARSIRAPDGTFYAEILGNVTQLPGGLWQYNFGSGPTSYTAAFTGEGNDLNAELSPGDPFVVYTDLI